MARKVRVYPEHQGLLDEPEQLFRGRERLTGLCETFSRVLSHFPAMPIKSKRVLMTLWHENEAVGLEALGRIERDAALRRQAELDLTERYRQQARTLIEAQVRVCARARACVCTRPVCTCVCACMCLHIVFASIARDHLRTLLS